MASHASPVAVPGDAEASGLQAPQRAIKSVRRLALITCVATVIAFISTPLPVVLVPIFVLVSVMGFKAAKTANVRRMRLFGACNAIFAVMAVGSLLVFLPTAIPTLDCACDSSCVDMAFLEANATATRMQQARFDMMAHGMDFNGEANGDRWALRGPGPQGQHDLQAPEPETRRSRPQFPRGMEAVQAPAAGLDAAHPAANDVAAPAPAAPASAPAPPAAVAAPAPAYEKSHEEYEAERIEGEEATRHRPRTSRHHGSKSKSAASHADAPSTQKPAEVQGSSAAAPANGGVMVVGKYGQDGHGRRKYEDEEEDQEEGTGKGLWGREQDEEDDDWDNDDGEDDEEERAFGASLLAHLFSMTGQGRGRKAGRASRRHADEPAPIPAPSAGISADQFTRFADRVCTDGPAFITGGVVLSLFLAIIHVAAALAARRLVRHPWFIQQDALRRASHPAYSAPAALAAAPSPAPQQGGGMAVPVALAPMPVQAGPSSTGMGLGSMLRSAWQSVSDATTRSRGYAPVQAGTAIQQDDAPSGIATASASADPQPIAVPAGSVMVVGSGPSIAGPIGPSAPAASASGSSIPMPYWPGMNNGPIATAYPVATPVYPMTGHGAGSPAAYTYAVRR